MSNESINSKSEPFESFVIEDEDEDVRPAVLSDEAADSSIEPSLIKLFKRSDNPDHLMKVFDEYSVNVPVGNKEKESVRKPAEENIELKNQFDIKSMDDISQEDAVRMNEAASTDDEKEFTQLEDFVDMPDIDESSDESIINEAEQTELEDNYDDVLSLEDIDTGLDDIAETDDKSASDLTDEEDYHKSYELADVSEDDLFPGEEDIPEPDEMINIPDSTETDKSLEELDSELSSFKEENLSIDDLDHDFESLEEDLSDTGNEKLSLDDLDVHPEIIHDESTEPDIIEKVRDESLTIDDIGDFDDIETMTTEEEQLSLKDLDMGLEELEEAQGEVVEDDVLTIDDLDQEFDFSIDNDDDEFETNIENLSDQIKDIEEPHIAEPDIESFDDQQEPALEEEKFVDKEKIVADLSLDKTNIDDISLEELRTLFIELDKLFGNLNEEDIKKFALSDIYDLYTKIMDKLDI